jgi:hypothetical protein
MTALEREISAKLDNKAGHGALLLHTVAIVGIILAVLAFGGERFSGGQSSTGAFSTQIVERERREADLNDKIDSLAQQIQAATRARPAQEIQGNAQQSR